MEGPVPLTNLLTSSNGFGSNDVPDEATLQRPLPTACLLAATGSHASNNGSALSQAHLLAIANVRAAEQDVGAVEGLEGCSARTSAVAQGHAGNRGN
eukprot:CAMPEP_0204606548 /NCGR_PEP_ID=MMETSP0661-20131031/59162_1 /ASSEMBLY_ACC=CAM_ASM_000606 /TAXON_ID=109239 /ORGANISM="Alexandrium margalefi, Strain AMGDE01CS-322" /LENGTH=96 /DNA_ID=CAMNT_0051617887 /DNA_START=507 /DNA_END=794 /DNA_ORIENTATION=-